MPWNKLKSLGFIVADNYEKLETKNAIPESCVFQILLHGAKRGRSLRSKRRYSILVSGRWNGEYCKLYGATE
jgi:hypothetical protein